MLDTTLVTLSVVKGDRRDGLSGTIRNCALALLNMNREMTI